MSEPVNVKSFVRAETDRMFASFAHDAGGVNQWLHIRQPTPLDHQPVIRMNRDTLYSVCIADISAGATLTVPDAGSRYVSVMIVNRDHYINRIIHDAGDHELTVDELDTPFVAVAARILVDPARPEDVAVVAALQDGFALRAGSAKSFEPPDYDTASLDATRASLLDLARGVDGFSGAFGANVDVDPVMHLCVNNLTAVADADGAITVHFGDWDDDTPNRLPVAEGWNYLVRMYRPHPEILDGSWVFPGVEPA